METKTIIILVVYTITVATVSFVAGRIYQWLITPKETDKSQTPLTPDEEGQL